ncbi:TIP41-domain-containing protein [Xylariaceae sp. FL0016]|nr:TIP41-domain-containing protein [Xylariaceae sp. FL0016]
MAARVANKLYALPPDPAQQTRQHQQRNFRISSCKAAISKADAIEEMEHALTIPIPEMIFGDNFAAVEHVPSGWRIEFNARDALDQVDKTGENMLQVAYARNWSASREQTSAGIKEVVRPYDWSYSTTYRGTLNAGEECTKDQSMAQGATTEKESRSFQPTTTPIPIELLKRQDPILFNDEVVLYESELDDNGVSVLSVKFRVHKHRMLLLCRLFMRLDNVVVRIRDTRIYVDFDTDEVTREYTVKEAGYELVKQKLLMKGLRPDGIIVALRDANQIADLLPVLDKTLESVSPKSDL